MSPEYRVGESVMVDGAAGIIRARVRADDDPRKCVPPGERFARRGHVRSRDATSYLVRLEQCTDLVWTQGKVLEPAVAMPPEGSARVSQDRVLADARALSMGTLSYLSGFNRYDELEPIHRAFIQHVIATAGNGVRYSSWIEAWRWFVNGYADRLKSYDEIDRLFTLVVPASKKADGEARVKSPGGVWMLRMDAAVAVEAPPAPGAAEIIRIGFIVRHWMTRGDARRLREWAAGGSATSSR